MIDLHMLETIVWYIIFLAAIIFLVILGIGFKELGDTLGVLERAVEEGDKETLEKYKLKYKKELEERNRKLKRK